MAVLCAGERLGNYVIEGPLGQGGMAEVYRGVHRLLERPVAIKVLSPALNADPTFPLRFLREARAVARLTHPHIVAVYDFDEYGELAYLVMQLATNGTLRDRARHFRTLADAVASLAAVGEALQYAHERGIVHRDVKPINVLIDDAGRPLLADFGLARLAHESLDLTLTGVSIGSPHYMAPEQALGHEVDHRADIYAYGIMACEVIAGRPPYVGPTPWAIIQQHLAAPPPSIRTFLPAAPAALEGALRRATAKRADERYAAIADLVADLRLAAAAAPDLSLDQRRATGAEDRPRGASGSHPSVARPTGSPGPTPPSVPPTPDVGDHTPDRPGDPDTATLLRPAGERPAWPVDPALATRMMPVATPPAAASAVAPPLPTPPLGPALATAVPPAPPRSRRPSAFEWWHWGIIGAVVAVLAGLGIAVVGRGGAAGAGDALRVGLLAVALLLAILNATLMRVAVLSDSHLARETYRRLRQQHRFVGYTAALLAIVAQALLWLALVHDGFTSPWLTLSFVSGLALLAAAVLKVGIVRFIPRWRRHLPVVAVVLLLCFVLALATNIGALLAPAVRPAITVAAPVPAATAAAVATPTVAPSAVAPTATAPVAPPGGYAADFRTWPTGGTAGQGRARVDPATGAYDVTASRAGATAAAYAPEGRAFAGFTLEVDARHVAGPGGGAYGLAFWVQPPGATGDTRARAVFEVTAQGAFRLYLVDADSTQQVVQPFRAAPAITPGGAVNHLAVTCRGSTVTLAVNGQMVGSYALEMVNSGEIGVSVSNPAGAAGTEAAFANLRLTPLP